MNDYDPSEDLAASRKRREWDAGRTSNLEIAERIIAMITRDLVNHDDLAGQIWDEIPRRNRVQAEAWWRNQIVEFLNGSAPETTARPARDADHCDFPDCEQHWSAEVLRLRSVLTGLLRHCDLDPKGETLFEVAVIAARKALRSPSPAETSAPDQDRVCCCGHPYKDHSCAVNGCDCGYFEAEDRAPETSGDARSNPLQKRVHMVEQTGPHMLARLEIHFLSVTDMQVASDYIRSLPSSLERGFNSVVDEVLNGSSEKASARPRSFDPSGQDGGEQR